MNDRQHEKRRFPALTVILSIALAISLGFSGFTYVRARDYEARLREIYEGAVLSAQRQMEDMQLSLMKAMLSADPSAVHQYLNLAGGGAAQVQRSLSLLPLSHGATMNAVKFANQLSDYTAVLIAETEISPRDMEQLQLLIAACQQSTQALQQAGPALALESARQSQPFYPADGETAVYDSAVSYPTLIYDGPFSDALQGEKAKGLPDVAITREQAHQIARDFVGADRVIALKDGADMGGDIPCYGVTLQLGDVTVEAAVTKQGGKVLFLTPDTADFAPEKTLEDCRVAALSFLESRGFPPMESTYFQSYQGVMVISFAPLQGETILYPDLVKVQLRMDTAQVVGLEARNYYLNHHPRGALSPALTLEEAQGMVSDQLRLEQTRLCLIPKQQREILCYEFQGDFQGNTYLVYINAETGRQEELLQVVEGSAGLETM